MSDEQERLIAEAEMDFEESERLRKLDEAERVMAEAEKYLENARNERSQKNEFPEEVLDVESEEPSIEDQKDSHEGERKVMIVDVMVIDNEKREGSEEDESEGDDESSESEELEKNSDNSCLGYVSLMGALFIGFFSFFVFYPPHYNADALWIAFTNSCCSIFHNATRCVLNITCKSRLDLWIYAMNNTVDYFNNCCYIYGAYDSWIFFAERYCDPFCLRPKLF